MVENTGTRRTRRRIAVVTGDTLTEKMAGPAIRAWNIASELAKEHEVELATTGDCQLVNPDFHVRHVGAAELGGLERWCEILLFQGSLLNEYPFLLASNKVIVVDLYDPMHLEQLEQTRGLMDQRRRDIIHAATVVLNQQILRGDFFLCASPKQRDFWLGHLAALGRINSVLYDADETLEEFIAVTPFGIPQTPPQHTTNMVKGVIPGIAGDDKVVLWGGGIYNWFDPVTLIRAMKIVIGSVPNARLLFMGRGHPNPLVPKMQAATAAREVSDGLGLTGEYVIFNDEWVRYSDRQNFLLESDVGVSTHLDHLETAFSFRTRILDYLWASLPMVCTRGDSLADLVEEHDLGITVRPGDVDGLADALVTLLLDDAQNARIRANVGAVAPRFYWSTTLRPLIEFCRDPKRAPDLLDADIVSRMGKPLEAPVPPWEGVRGDAQLFREYFRRGGVSLVARKGGQRLRRVISGQRRPRAR
jgi:glycosyltransferase involved in cell wall biosynthesis